MPLINQSIPNLSQGVSQQPDAIRHLGQGDTQENMYSSVVDGLLARPNSNNVGELGSAKVFSADCFIHSINRDASNRHVLIIEPNSSTPLIYDTINGTAKTVYDAPTSNGTSFSNYIQTSSPRTDLQALTVADTTYVLNKTKQVAMTSAVSASLEKKAVVFVKQGDYKKEFHVDINIGGTTYRCGYRSGDGSSSNSATRIIGSAEGVLNDAKYAGYVEDNAEAASTTKIAQGLYGAMFASSISSTSFTLARLVGETSSGSTDADGNNYSDATNGGAILITYSGSSSFNVSTHDGQGNTGVGVIHNEVTSISDLPASCFHGMKVKVRGDVELVQDDYWVKFVSKDSGASTDDYGEGSWEETIAPEVKTTLDASTLPCVIAPQSATPTNYYYAEDSWDDRLVGDDDTNALPSFINSDESATIEQMFFFKNRRGFLSGQSVIMSENDDYTNFFRTSTLSLLDSDRIDVGVSHTKVSFLKHARAFQEKLILFSEQSQFVLRGNNLLTPATVNISPVTEYQTQTGVEPLAQGDFIYFPFTRGDYQGIQEYYVDATTDTFRAEEITSHIPRYIPSTVKQMVGTQSEDVIALTTTSNQKEVYIYKYFWNNKEKIQASWSKFTFTHDIVGIFFIESDLYLISEDGTQSWLDKMPLESGLVDSGFAYTIRLDSRQQVNDSAHSVSYDSGAKTTTITPGINCDGIEVWSANGLKATKASNTSTTITVNGDWRSATLTSYIGYPISWEFEMSKPNVKQQTNRGGLTTSNYSYQVVRTGAVEYAQTGHFTVEVSKKYRDTFTHVFNPTTLGADSIIGELVLEDGSFRYPIYSNVDDLTVKLKGSSALPARFLSAEFESTVASRSSRYA